jgi:dipeptidyl aminopeptidase/acylaminoacyl peptidase
MRPRQRHSGCCDCRPFFGAMMERESRVAELYREIGCFCSGVRQPGAGQISDVAQVHGSPDGAHIVFCGTVARSIEEEPPTYLALTELATGITRLLTSGRNTDKLPRFSPDGRSIAFLSDRRRANDFQLCLLDRQGGTVRETPRIEGSVEHLQWSSDGKKILLRVVGPKANGRSTGHAGALRAPVENAPPWLPLVDPAEEGREHRSCWIHEIASDAVHAVAASDCNTWEVSWCGNEMLAAVASSRAGEGDWYSAGLCLIDAQTGKHREIYRPTDQLGALAASPAGKSIAIIEGLASDRGPVSGALLLFDPASGTRRTADTHGVDVWYAQWYSDRHLLVSGNRGFATVVGLCDAVSGRFTEIWSSQDLGVTKLGLSALQAPGDCVLVTESFTHAPELIAIRHGQCRRVAGFDIGYAEAVNAIAGVERVTWSAPDELQIQGWLLRPSASLPLPLVMDVHGGPVGQWGPAFLMRRMLHVPILLEHGFAVFLPNPRGSSGRGQEFAHRVLGDLGGADSQDLLSGLDALIERGVADPTRLGVNGTSYGGFMAAWLVTQCARFSAAVAVSPHTNQVTAHLLSNIPQFMSRLVGDDLSNGRGRYFERSPVIHARRARTPMLNICGALDRCTPAEEAIQFHNALLLNGTKSVLVTYPQEGHGIRKLPAMMDCAARISGWFLEHILAR